MRARKFTCQDCGQVWYSIEISPCPECDCPVVDESEDDREVRGYDD